MRTNKKATDYRVDKSARLAGGFGTYAAKQNAEALLRRAVLANLLWEDLCYEDGISVVDNIRNLIPQVAPEKVASIAVEARSQQKLRHVPLLIAREMARLDTHKGYVGTLLPQIILRADELTEFLALYWQDGKCPLSKQVKVGLASAFNRFDEYQLGKYNRANEIKLRDVLFLTHPKPDRQLGQVRQADAVSRKGYKRGKVLRHDESLLGKLAEDELAVPDTWEVALSAGKNKRETWERLIRDRKIGALAFVRNLRNMEQANVSHETILYGFENVNPRWLLPLNYLAAANAAPRWERELETLMLRGLATAPRLAGYSLFVLDVSGSMRTGISSKSAFTRLDAGIAMAILAAEMCERIAIYATAGSDGMHRHKTELLKPRRGFALMDEIKNSERLLGGGGIFTRQCLEYMKAHESSIPDRIIVFSDSQDCDYPEKRIPAPFGKHNYIVDVSSHSHGVNYDGLWDAEITGWSERFLPFIAAVEGVELTQQDSDQ